MSGEVFVDQDRAADLGLPAWSWTSFSRWAVEHRTTVPMVRTRIADGELKCVDGGKFRRWVLEPG